MRDEKDMWEIDPNAGGRWRRRLLYGGLTLTAILGIGRIVAIPWSWQYQLDTVLKALFYCVAVPTLVLCWLHARRVFPEHCCPSCGYNLTGNVSGVCPECGTPIPDERPGGQST
jgi:hypothetical protein